MPIYDKPTIYYPLATLMEIGISEVLIITTPEEQQNFVKLLQDGSQWGIKIQYAIQSKPNGLAEAYIIAEDFLNGQESVMILGDNIFHSNELFVKQLKIAASSEENTIFAYRVSNPSAYGVVTFNDQNKVIDLEEKPKKPKSDHAVPGIYFFDKNASTIAKSLEKSQRGELEIMDICKTYMNQENLHVLKVPEGVAWLDTGTHESMIDAALYVRIIEQRQGYKIACLEEIAYKNKWIDADQLQSQIKKMGKSTYCEYLKRLI